MASKWRWWTSEEVAYLKEFYFSPDYDASVAAKYLNRTVMAVYSKTKRMSESGAFNGCQFN